LEETLSPRQIIPAGCLRQNAKPVRGIAFGAALWLSEGVTGSIINALAILLGAVLGLIRKSQPSAENQQFMKLVLGLATVVVGLRLVWISVNGSLLQILWQLGIVLVAMMLGRLLGKLLRFQQLSNRLGHYARDRIAALQKSGTRNSSDGVNVCAALFCVAPLGWLGATTEALGGGPWVLLVKAVMEGLAAMGFVMMFGWGVALSALPVLAVQGTIALLVALFVQPFLATHGLVDAVNATAGLIIFSVSLLVFEVRRVEVADYLPSLAIAPLLMFLLK
jgi:uncharacterized membrane protein YqgA involved in biofilm formation